MERDYEKAISRLQEYADENYPGQEIMEMYIPSDPKAVCKATLESGKVFFWTEC